MIAAVNFAGIIGGIAFIGALAWIIVAGGDH